MPTRPAICGRQRHGLNPVFLSYSGTDLRRALGLRTLLRALAVLCWSVLVAPFARAQDLVYQWSDGQTLHYVIEVYLDDYHWYAFEADGRWDAAAWVVQLQCTVEVRSSGWRTLCRPFLDEVYLGHFYSDTGTTRFLTAPFAVEIVADWSDRGRLRTYDIRGDRSPRGEDREAEQDKVRSMLGALELELPKGGDDKGKHWKQGGAYPMMKARPESTLAGRLRHEVVAREGSVIRIESVGRASEQSTDNVGSTQAWFVQHELVGDATFNVEEGLLEERFALVTRSLTDGAGRGAGRVAHFARRVDGFSGPVERIVFPDPWRGLYSQTGVTLPAPCHELLSKAAVPPWESGASTRPSPEGAGQAPSPIRGAPRWPAPPRATIADPEQAAAFHRRRPVDGVDHRFAVRGQQPHLAVAVLEVPAEVHGPEPVFARIPRRGCP
ncbi:MAG: hypothetical protein JRI25_02710 [Deltaproteobacteria bacterium]|nr:hypothetical protein [Deltaproteobacteria bacterium]